MCAVFRARSFEVYSSIAQSVEHAAVNRGVVSSSLTRGAISFNQKGNSQKDHKILWSFCYLSAVSLLYLDCRVQNIETFFQ